MYPAYARWYKKYRERKQPERELGLSMGVGGLAGTYAGARLQRYVPERLIRGVLGTLVTLLALRYIL